MKKLESWCYGGLLFLGSLGLILPCWSQGDEFQALIFGEGGSQAKTASALYGFERTEKKEKGRLVATQGLYFLPGTERKVVLKEDLTFDASEVLKSYVISQEQLKQTWNFRKEGQEILFFHQASETPKKEKWVENLVVGPTLIPYLRKKREALLAGESLSVRFAALERRETVGFFLRKTGESEREGIKRIHVQMKPSSFFVALAFPPIDLELEREGFRLLRMKGRMLPKLKKQDQWLDFEGEMLVQPLNMGN